MIHFILFSTYITLKILTVPSIRLCLAARWPGTQLSSDHVAGMRTRKPSASCYCWNCASVYWQNKTLESVINFHTEITLAVNCTRWEEEERNRQNKDHHGIVHWVTLLQPCIKMASLNLLGPYSQSFFHSQKPSWCQEICGSFQKSCFLSSPLDVLT